MPPASTPNPPAPALLAENFWFSIVLSVSTEIECSVLCEEAIPRTGKPRGVTS
ncbi:hypothetical protein SLEP1_g39176 [Rubroshorea leprosula]|uniref:Uncharacterized protein n=1 Tax=Rubroshorea leprosula TaxID=152421 RepID=A0AAV5KZJ2_9ROSI|nr:hypothetical protein SLEP1_g39176 [Rubroshorea leprosula]